MILASTATTAETASLGGIAKVERGLVIAPVTGPFVVFFLFLSRKCRAEHVTVAIAVSSGDSTSNCRCRTCRFRLQGRMRWIRSANDKPLLGTVSLTKLISRSDTDKATRKKGTKVVRFLDFLLFHPHRLIVPVPLFLFAISFSFSFLSFSQQTHPICSVLFFRF